MDSARVIDKLERVARAGTDLVTLWRDTGPLLAEAVPHFEGACFFTVDPSSLLATSHFQEGLPEIPGEWLGREYAEGDYNSMREVLRSAPGVGTLDDATGGRPELSRKFHEEMQPFGCDQELLVALRTPDKEAWGMVGLYRETGRPRFSAPDLELVRRVAPGLAAGARHALLLGQALEPDLPEAPGLVVFDDGLSVTSATPTAPDWLADLGGTLESPPAGVLTVVGEVLGSGGPALSRVRGDSRRWVVLQGSPLVGRDGRRQVSVIVQKAQPAHLISLLMHVYGLTAREQEVTRLVLRGESTQAIARELVIAGGTVQAHLRNIFEKTGVRSRRELVAVAFQRHYEPRVRDNEQRTAVGRPCRHGPMPA
ncbi:helix-turn-helix transcriptional regulator [Nocardioides sp.]|uniref:helix-turn-helix transcriptional regulator n=1 Tax=Nocardioides sp. TaxID=35761 RepID=UPI002735BED3|nr:helix-turn-helix transcriptional regulator [Nocardioides sp.]MDP3894384.1 helix-turn-helix transcriptional regulator [Nocardioides sp.]